jgi:hypothetical protein
MYDIALCPECGVPEPLGKGQIWLNNGDIVQSLNPQARMALIECENLDPLFKNIGALIGISIEHIIVNITARAAEIYMGKLIPKEIKDVILSKQADPALLAVPVLAYCHILGYGKYRFSGYRYEEDQEDYSRFIIIKPFSAPLAAGAMAGALSSIVGGEHNVSYEEISPGIYEFVTNWTEYPEELKERFPLVPYVHRDGDIDLERCAACGVPKAFSNYRWKLEEGLIIDERTGRRMAFLGPESLDNLFEALEEELGETIPSVVVEAQRRFTMTGFYSMDRLNDEMELRTQLALRGLGNLREIRMEPDGLLMRIDNAAGYLMTVGMVQGLFEITFHVESHVEWALSQEGNLEVEIKPKV